jgi:hypothetical protein
LVANVLYVLKIIGIVVGVFVAIIYLLMVLNTLLDFIRAKTKNINAHTDAVKNGSLNEKIVDTTNLLLIIDSMIKVEILQIRSTHLSLNQPYEILRKLDKDIVEISTTIHNSLKAELFANPSNMIVNSEYIEKYIVNTATTELIAMVKQLNREIAERNVANQG